MVYLRYVSCHAFTTGAVAFAKAIRSLVDAALAVRNPFIRSQFSQWRTACYSALGKNQLVGNTSARCAHYRWTVR